MANYENTYTFKVHALAKDGDKDAMFEMTKRIDDILPDVKDPMERNAWEDIWCEKAAEAGHVEAKFLVARAHMDKPYDGPVNKYHKIAKKYFQELSDEYNKGRLSGGDKECGEISKLWLGIMYCLGKGTPRNEKKGVELIEEASGLTNDFATYGFFAKRDLGRMFVNGYAQTDEEPTEEDLIKGKKYLEAALVARKNQLVTAKVIEGVKRDLEFAQKGIDIKKHITTQDIEKILQSTTLSYSEYKAAKAIQRREEIMKISDEMKQKLDAYEAAREKILKRLEKKYEEERKDIERNEAKRIEQQKKEQERIEQERRRKEQEEWNRKQERSKVIKIFGIIGMIVGLIIGLNSGSLFLFILSIIVGGWIGIGIPTLFKDFTDFTLSDIFDFFKELFFDGGCLGIIFFPLKLILLIYAIIYTLPKESLDEWILYTKAKKAHAVGDANSQ